MKRLSKASSLKWKIKRKNHTFSNKFSEYIYRSKYIMFSGINKTEKN